MQQADGQGRTSVDVEESRGVWNLLWARLKSAFLREMSGNLWRWND